MARAWTTRTIDTFLVFPERPCTRLTLNPLLVPFARKHRCILLFGMVYHAEPRLAGSPLINSCQWLIPEWTSNNGFQLRAVEQGKRHLTADEVSLTPTPVGFRPAQWLVEYMWSSNRDHRPLTITASVCYDATDLGLAADLRDMSGVLAIPALNKDVRTFDQMALALHYHMFQLVVVANNGQYGGSNAYWPRSDPYIRQVFHMHGQPQASIAFLEIDDIAEFLERRDASGANANDWKHPPAGLRVAAPGGSP